MLRHSSNDSSSDMMESPPGGTLRIALINMHGKYGISDDRKRLIEAQVLNYRPDVILSQEVQWVDPFYNPQYSGSPHLNFNDGYNYECENHKEGSIFYKKKGISKQNFKKPSNGPHGMSNRVTFTCLGFERGSIIFGSVHGQYNKTSEPQRARNIENLISYCEELRDLNDLEVIVGGDFNYDLARMNLPENRIQLPTAEPNRRERREYDHFFCFPRKGKSSPLLSDVGVTRLINSSSTEKSEYSEEQSSFIPLNGNELLDHDMLVANYSFE
eukprot:gb/GECH01013180.1/.p1 GENE.gb/GECH01013180.1/~~gb/GECH01013180.1/.p1  ORF type:complete len:271 (+),score=25.43 gb/GECH01013180.1/:1-813(+)